MKIREGAGVLVVAAVVSAACAGSEPAKPKPAASPAVDYAANGEAVAKEILAVFNEAVAETATLVKDKPAATTLMPQLDGLFAKYEAKMKTINPKRRALASEPSALSAAGKYMDDNRPKAVFDKDNALGPFIFHYTNEKKSPEVAAFLNSKIVTLIDIGDAH